MSGQNNVMTIKPSRWLKCFYAAYCCERILDYCYFFCTLDVLHLHSFISVSVCSTLWQIYRYNSNLFKKMLSVRVFLIHFLWSDNFDRKQPRWDFLWPLNEVMLWRMKLFDEEWSSLNEVSKKKFFDISKKIHQVPFRRTSTLRYGVDAIWTLYVNRSLKHVCIHAKFWLASAVGWCHKRADNL